MIKWSNCKNDFLKDGSLRDIYILEATVGDWQKLLNFIRTMYEASFSLNSKKIDFSDDVIKLFWQNGKSGGQLNFFVQGIPIFCHFFSAEEIEFDFLPNDIKGQKELDSILMFVKEAGDLLDKDVLITPENVQENPIIKYSRKDKSFEYFPK